MSQSFWRDFRSLLRGAKFITSGPRAIMDACQGTLGVLRIYDELVPPIIDNYIQDAGTRKWLTESTRSYTATMCWIIRAYTRMANIAFIADVAVLGSVFNRLYDDLLDEFRCDNALGARIGELFRFGDFKPASDAEQVLHELYKRIRNLLERPADDPIFGAVLAVHEYQTRSYGQPDSIRPEALLEITQGKGGYAAVVLLGLMRKSMQADEIDLLLRLGEILQMLDDYQDRTHDTEKGRHTLATEGLLRLPDIGNLLRASYPDFRRFYGRDRVAPFWALLYSIMMHALISDNWPRWRIRNYPATKGVGWSLKILLAPDSGQLSNRQFKGNGPLASGTLDAQDELESGQ